MRSHPGILLDLDGVLVDNVAFENAVTEYILSRLAAELDLDPGSASAAWRRELQESKGNPEWCDYDFHCRRLGLPDLARDAHQACIASLSRVREAERTLAMLAEAGARVGVATDAMSWVAYFKLEALDLPRPAFMMSCDRAQARKSSPRYWEAFQKAFPEEAATVYVDNRLANLHAAVEIIPGLDLVFFVGDEHVLRTGIVDPNPPDADSSGNAVTTVADHPELMERIAQRLAAAPRTTLR
jgi:FMN phosphatase YigB (HAD superfamily)